MSKDRLAGGDPEKMVIFETISYVILLTFEIGSQTNGPYRQGHYFKLDHLF